MRHMETMFLMYNLEIRAKKKTGGIQINLIVQSK